MALALSCSSVAYAPVAAPAHVATRAAAPAMYGVDDLKSLAKEANPVVGYYDPLSELSASLASLP